MTDKWVVFSHMQQTYRAQPNDEVFDGCDIQMLMVDGEDSEWLDVHVPLSGLAASAKWALRNYGLIR